MHRLAVPSQLSALVLRRPRFGTRAAGHRELRGRVLDAQNAVLPGVTVVAKNEGVRPVPRNRQRRRRLVLHERVDAGRRTRSTAQLAGFKRYQRGGVRVEVGKTSPIDVQLEVGGIEQAVTVTAESPLVDTSIEADWRHVTVAGTERRAVDQPELHHLSRACCQASPRRFRSIRSAPTRSGSTGRRRRTRTTCWTAPATTTTSTAATAARRRGRRSKRCRSSSC